MQALRNQKHEPHRKGPTVIRTRPGERLLGQQQQQQEQQQVQEQQQQQQQQVPTYDVVICGGTLGLFLGATLQQRGHKVRTPHC
jgi:hypothetical protein